MSQDTKRFCLLVTLCSALGVMVGATTSQAAIDRCLTVDSPQKDCLAQPLLLQRIEAMGQGLLIGAGAAVGASLGRRQEG